MPGGDGEDPRQRADADRDAYVAGRDQAVLLVAVILALEWPSDSRPSTSVPSVAQTISSSTPKRTPPACSTRPPSSVPTSTLSVEVSARAPRVSAVTYLTGSNIIATGDVDGDVLLWNATTGKFIHNLLEEGGSPSQGINDFAYSSKDDLLAATDQNGFTYVWNLTTGNLAYPALQDQQTYGGVKSAAFSPNGQLLVTGDGNSDVNVWNASSGDFEGAPAAENEPAVTALAFSPDNSTLVVGYSNGTIAFWPVDNLLNFRAVPTDTVADEKKITDLVFSANGQMLAVADAGGDTTLVDPNTTGALSGWYGSGNDSSSSVAFIHNGDILAAGGSKGQIFLWNTATYKLIYTFTDPNGSNIDAIAFGPDGKSLTVVDANANAYVWGTGFLIC
jgi:WD40 repeat protein